MHTNLQPLHELLGSWQGFGTVEYPTMPNPIEYGEQVTFASMGDKPIIFYQQKTWNKLSNKPLHAESGYIRVQDNGELDFSLSQPTGTCEILQGKWKSSTPDCIEILLQSTSITRAKSAIAPYTVQTQRQFTINKTNHTLTYEFSMSTTNTPTLTRHLRATLCKV